MTEDNKKWYRQRTFWMGFGIIVNAPLLAFGVPPTIVAGISAIVLGLAIIFMREAISSLFEKVNGNGKVPIIILCLLLLTVAGCSDVIMSPAMSTNLDSAIIHATDLDNRANPADPNIAPDVPAARENSRVTTKFLKAIADARDGKEVAQ